MCTPRSCTNSGSTRGSSKSPAASGWTWTTARRSGRSLRRAGRGCARPTMEGRWASGSTVRLAKPRPTLLDCQILHAEQPVVVRPNLAEGQSRRHGQFAERFTRVLVRVLRANALARGEPDRHAADLHHLALAADQVHFDP